MNEQPQQPIGLTDADIAQIEQPTSIRERALSTAKILTAGVVGYLTCKYAGEAFDMTYVPEVPVFPQITEGITIANDSLRTVAPGVVAAAASSTAYTHLKARTDTKTAAYVAAAKNEYSGNGIDKTGGKFRNSIRKMAAGTALAATVLISAAAGIEHEVKEGPTRAIDTAIEVLSPEDENPFFVVQDTTQQFMNNSYVSRQQADELIVEAQNQGITAVPFYRELGDIIDENDHNVTNLTIGVPDEIFNGILVSEGVDPATVQSGSCENVPIIIDDDSQKEVGDIITIQGQSSEVVAVISRASSMNRVAAIERGEDLAECIQRNPEANYYGVALSGASESEIKELYEDSAISEVAPMITTADLKKYNEKFWGANGTPILLQLMLYLGAFGFIANRNEKRATIQKDIKEMGALNAGGVTNKDFQKIESLRALKQSAVAAAVSIPLAPMLAAGVNAAEWGLKVGISAREIAVGFTLTFGAKLFGARRAISKFSSKLSASEAMKG